MTLLCAASPGCSERGCLTGTDDDCVVPPACEPLLVTCTGGETELYVLGESDPAAVGGPDALGATGDVVLANDRIVAVLDALDHPHYVAPSGGALLDLAPRGGSDGLRNLFQATGLLPGDAVHYTEVRLLDEGEVKAVQYRGTLDGHPDIHVATRYELRPCEDGLRIRTEVVNREPDPYPMFLLDAFYWGDREHLPFTPGSGFEQPPFGLTTLVDAIRAVPWMAGGAHGANAASYGLAPCDRKLIEGVQSREISAVGPARRVLFPRDYEIYERYLSVAEGPEVSGASDVLLEVRRQLLGEDYVTVEGRVAAEDGGELGSLARASMIASHERDAWTHVVPEADGSYHFRGPPGRYTLAVDTFGQRTASVTVHAHEDTTAPEVRVPGAGRLTLEAWVDGQPDLLLAYLYPAEGIDPELLAGTVHGQLDACAPFLGVHFGPSPACNRVLVDGSTTIELPDGLYDVYAAAGPFGTLARVAGVSVDGGTAQSVLLEVDTLPLQPAGTLSADFHVHGRASFDSALPDLDRVRSFLAARVQVVASTDHDVVNDYAEAIAETGAADRMKVLVGLETTGHVLFPLVETTIYPKVIGHFNFWPVPYDERGPWRGAPWDELAEPGELFSRLAEAGFPETGVIQLNHPWGGVQFGRDFAWPTAIGLDLTQPLPPTYDGTGQGLFLRTPPGSAYGNAEYDAQEVMNGTNNNAFLQYRAIWHYLLNEGVVRAGTANSDSHTLYDNTLGTPRTLVWTEATLESWDEPTFNAAVKAGRMMGTNGPIIELTTTDAQGGARSPGVEPFAPAADAVLALKVSAAPWVPVQEVRILVGGEVVRTLSDLPVPLDPLGQDGLVRLETEIALSELVSGSEDAWLVVEAGAPLRESADLDCNGVPDTTDNDGNGSIDWRDVEELEEDPGVDCLETVGPLLDPPVPEPADPASWFSRVTPGGVPASFTNPLLLDLDGDGSFGAGR
jgi:hypothetical protein